MEIGLLQSVLILHLLVPEVALRGVVVEAGGTAEPLSTLWLFPKEGVPLVYPKWKRTPLKGPPKRVPLFRKPLLAYPFIALRRKTFFLFFFWGGFLANHISGSSSINPRNTLYALYLRYAVELLC